MLFAVNTNGKLEEGRETIEGVGLMISILNKYTPIGVIWKNIK